MDMAKRVAHVVQACFAGKRIVVFSGGPAKDLAGIYDEARAIREDLAKSLDVYAYFNNDIGGHAVHNARDVRRYVEETGARAVA